MKNRRHIPNLMIVDTYMFITDTLIVVKIKYAKGSVAALNVQINHAYPNKASTSSLNEP